MEKDLINWLRNNTILGINQRGSEWMKLRNKTIGGSSIGIITGTNRFKSLYDFIVERVTALSITEPDSKSNINVEWGNLFEDTAKEIIEKKYNTTVHGDNVFLMPSQYLSFSPDGLAVIDKQNFYASANENEQAIVLLEFKCPQSRKLSRQPTPAYKQQVEMGLQLIPIADFGVLFEFVFRRCAMDDLSIYRVGHIPNINDKYLKFPFDPSHIGFISFTFHGSDASYINFLHNKYPETVIDMAHLSDDDMNDFFSYHVKSFQFFRHSQCFNDEQNLATLIRCHNIERKPDIILTWKLFEMNTHIIERTDISKYFDKCEQISKLIHACEDVPIPIAIKKIDNFLNPQIDNLEEFIRQHSNDTQ